MWRAKLRACRRTFIPSPCPRFKNKSQTYRIEAKLTAAVVRELNTRTQYRIVSDPADADATMRGSVLSTQIEPLTYDSRTGRASSGVITIRMSVTLTGSNGEVLFQQSKLPVPRRVPNLRAGLQLLRGGRPRVRPPLPTILRALW